MPEWGRARLSQGRVLVYEAVGRGRFVQWHDAVYEDFERSRPPQLEGPLEVLLALCPRPLFTCSRCW